MTTSPYDDDPLVFEEYESDGLLVRLSMYSDLEPVLTIETVDGVLRCMTIRGDLDQWMTSAGERCMHIRQRQEAA